MRDDIKSRLNSGSAAIRCRMFCLAVWNTEHNNAVCYCRRVCNLICRGSVRVRENKVLTWQETGENYLMRSFTVFTSHQMLFGWTNKGECDTQSMWHAGGRKCMQGFVRKPTFKRQLWIPRRRWENNIKVDLKNAWRACTGLIRLRTGRDRGLLWTR